MEMNVETITVNGKTPLEIRFMNRVRRSRGCCEWMGEVMSNGYGRFGFNKTRVMAHRMSYVLNIGSIEDGNVVHHKCYSKKCVNPAHLISVTSKENTFDYQNKRKP